MQADDLHPGFHPVGWAGPRREGGETAADSAGDRLEPEKARAAEFARLSRELLTLPKVAAAVPTASGRTSLAVYLQDRSTARGSRGFHYTGASVSLIRGMWLDSTVEQLEVIFDHAGQTRDEYAHWQESRKYSLTCVECGRTHTLTALDLLKRAAETFVRDTRDGDKYVTRFR